MKKFLLIFALLLLSVGAASAETCQWAEGIGGSDGDYAYSIALDASGNVYVAGNFKSSTLTFNNGKTLTNSGSYDGYIAKYAIK